MSLVGRMTCSNCGYEQPSKCTCNLCGYDHCHVKTTEKRSTILCGACGKSFEQPPSSLPLRCPYCGKIEPIYNTGFTVIGTNDQSGVIQEVEREANAMDAKAIREFTDRIVTEADSKAREVDYNTIKGLIWAKANAGLYEVMYASIIYPETIKRLVDEGFTVIETKNKENSYGYYGTEWESVVHTVKW